MLHIIVFWIICIVINRLINSKLYGENPEGYTSSTEEFVVRSPKLVAIVGTIGAAFISVLYIGLSSQEAITAGWIIFLAIVFGVCLCMMLSKLPRFWDVRFTAQDVTIIKFFILKKNFQVSQLERCVVKRGEILVYAKNRKRTAFMVDALNYGVENFIERMKKEQIPMFEKINGIYFPIKNINGTFVFVEEQLTEEQQDILANINPASITAKREIELN